MSDIPPGHRAFVDAPQPMPVPRTELERRIDIALNPDKLLFSHNPIVAPIDVVKRTITKVVLDFVEECRSRLEVTDESCGGGGGFLDLSDRTAYNGALNDLGRAIARDEDPPPAPTTYVFDHAFVDLGQLRLKIIEKDRHPIAWKSVSIDEARELIAEGRLEGVTL